MAGESCEQTRVEHEIEDEPFTDKDSFKIRLMTYSG